MASDAQLLAAARERDPGFDAGVFAHLLATAATVARREVARYGIDAETLSGVVERLSGWSQGILATLREGAATSSMLDGPTVSGQEPDGSFF